MPARVSYSLIFDEDDDACSIMATGQKVQVWIGRMRRWDGSFGTQNKPLSGFTRDHGFGVKRAGRCARRALCLFFKLKYAIQECCMDEMPQKPCRISDYY